MPICKLPQHIYEPTPLQCGQAVLSMVLGIDVSDIIKACETDRETDFKCMQRILKANGVSISSGRTAFINLFQLPEVALLSLETPKCWHWSLFIDGKFYDPEYGLIDDLPPCKRRYFWALENE